MGRADGNRRRNALDCRVSALASTQYGVVTRAQLQAIGLTTKAIRGRRDRGGLAELHPGVYAVGHIALTPLARELAAVLACRPQAYLATHSAGAVWGFLERDPAGPVHVTVVGHNPGTRDGVVVRRARHIEHTSRYGIPITTPAQTFVDLAATLSPLGLGHAFDEARVQGLISPSVLAGALDQHPRCPGVAALRALTRDDRRGGFSLAGTEQLIWKLIRRAGLPIPERNVTLGRWTVDLYWRAQGVAVELDGYDFHTTRGAFERDHEKDHVLRAHDIDLLRFTWHQVHDRPEQTLVRIAAGLARPRRAA